MWFLHLLAFVVFQLDLRLSSVLVPIELLLFRVSSGPSAIVSWPSIDLKISSTVTILLKWSFHWASSICIFFGCHRALLMYQLLLKGGSVSYTSGHLLYLVSLYLLVSFTNFPLSKNEINIQYVQADGYI